MAIEMKKTKVKMNKPVYLGKSILDISKMLMYECWCDYVKPKYQDKAKLYYMDTDCLFIHIKTKDFYKDIAKDVERWFDTSNYSEDDKTLLPICKDKKVIGLFKDELGRKIMKEFVALRAKKWAYLMFDDKIILKSQQRFKSDYHNVYTEQINKIALSSNDDKRLQTFDKLTPYRTNAFKACEMEMLRKYKQLILMMKAKSKTENENENKTEKWLYIPDHPYRILIIRCSGSGKQMNY